MPENDYDTYSDEVVNRSLNKKNDMVAHSHYGRPLSLRNLYREHNSRALLKKTVRMKGKLSLAREGGPET